MATPVPSPLRRGGVTRRLTPTMPCGRQGTTAPRRLCGEACPPSRHCGSPRQYGGAPAPHYDSQQAVRDCPPARPPRSRVAGRPSVRIGARAPRFLPAPCRRRPLLCGAVERGGAAVLSPGLGQVREVPEPRRPLGPSVLCAPPQQTWRRPRGRGGRRRSGSRCWV